MGNALRQIRLMGFKDWLYYSLKLDEIGAWFARIYYCHHNADVIADFEHRMSCVLCECTRGMSKPYYTVEAMCAEINDFVQATYQEGYDEGYANAKAEFGDEESNVLPSGNK